MTKKAQSMPTQYDSEYTVNNHENDRGIENDRTHTKGYKHMQCMILICYCNKNVCMCF